MTTQQELAVDLLASGKTVTETVVAIGVSRQTVSGWMNRSAEFRAGLNARYQELWAAMGDRLQALLPDAVEALASELYTRHKQSASRTTSLGEAPSPRRSASRTVAAISGVSTRSNFLPSGTARSAKSITARTNLARGAPASNFMSQALSDMARADMLLRQGRRTWGKSAAG